MSEIEYLIEFSKLSFFKLSITVVLLYVKNNFLNKLNYSEINTNLIFKVYFL